MAVGVTDLDGTAAEAVASELRASDGAAVAGVADVTDQGSVTRVVAAVEQALGPIDVLVNNAGWDRLELFLENDPALWDRLIAVNLKGVLFTTRAVLEGMVPRRGGRVVSVASDAARGGSTGE